MMRKKNIGVTLVEVLIALAIFLVLMVPLVSSLVTSTKTTDSAKTAQGRNEYAEVIMENIKNAPIDDLKSSAKVGNYFAGSESVTTTMDPGSSTNFTILGTTYLGTKHEQYSYKVKLDEYKHSDTFGIMEDLDPNKVAIVPVTFSNYDDVALDAIVTQNVSDNISSRLNASKEDTNKSRIFNKEETGTTVDYVDTRSSYQDDTKKTRKVLKSDTDTTNALRLDNVSIGRRIKISISRGNYKKKVGAAENTVNGYYVEYELSYVKIDPTKDVYSFDTYVTYKPYRKVFENIPNIYIMYNAGVINDYITNDYIVFDDSAISGEKTNAFVIRTNNDYSKLSGASSTLKDELDALYKNRVQDNYKTADDADEAVKNEAASKLAADVSKHGLGSKITSNNNSKPLYRQAGAASRDKITNIYGNSGSGLKVYHNLFAGDGTSLVNATNLTVDSLSNAYEEIWYIYNVKVWMQKGTIDQVKDVTDPNLITIQGTRGGGEFE